MDVEHLPRAPGVKFLQSQLPVSDSLACISEVWEMKCDRFVFFLGDAWNGRKSQKLGGQTGCAGPVLGRGRGVLGVEGC